ncbi:MAG: Fic family protein [Thermoplasmata archaeon]|nr:Fic family protein [Thermoplasmata archaeon]
MFKPNFRYTNRMIKNLTAIAEARAIILNAPLVPKWEVSLRRDALLRNAHSSTAIEGNPLSLEEVTALAEGREIMVRRKDKQEVLNYLNALDAISDYATKSVINSDDILHIHRLVSKDTLENPKDVGVFRNRQVVVGNRFTGEIIFTPPPTPAVPGLVDAMLDWYNSESVNETDSVIEAGIVHYEFVRIHPFVDGNGRTARVLAALTLVKRGFDIKRFFALDDYYDHDRRSYYEALRTVDPATRDLTQWLEYFVEGVAVSIEAVKNEVVGLSKNIKVLKEKGQIALNERQIKIVQRMIEKGSITNKEIREMLAISNRAALNEIDKLTAMNVIKKKGEGRSTHYELE